MLASGLGFNLPAEEFEVRIRLHLLESTPQYKGSSSHLSRYTIATYVVYSSSSLNWGFWAKVFEVPNILVSVMDSLFLLKSKKTRETWLTASPL